MTWFYILTLQWTHPGLGVGYSTASGTITMAAAATRGKVYRELLADGKRAVGPAADNAAVLFFSLEPDPIPAALEPALTAGGAS